jgi:hypothetical protein
MIARRPWLGISPADDRIKSETPQAIRVGSDPLPPASARSRVDGDRRRRRDTREHVGLYLTAFNAWATGTPISQLRFTPRDTVPPIAQVS